MPKTACVVGAGPSGLVAAKTLLLHPKGLFSTVCIVDVQGAVGGLWPSSPTDSLARQVHPLMLANQSRHTMHFADLAWDSDADVVPRAWQVGRYLRRYLDRYLDPCPGFRLRLRTRVVCAEPCSGGGGGGEGGWNLVLETDDGSRETAHFDCLVVASGYFGKPVIPAHALPEPLTVPVVHSSQYRDLKSLLGTTPPPANGRILVVGGQMSGVEIAGTIASHLSAAANAPDGQCALPGADGLTVHHLIQRPIWVMPTFTTPEPKAKAPAFLPLDFASYNANNRSVPLENTQGHISKDAARSVHAIFEHTLGTDQAVFSPLLRFDDNAKAEPPYLAVSDWYCDFARSGRIVLSKGKLDTLRGTTAVVTSPDGIDEVSNVVAVILATGFDPSASLSFLPRDALDKLHYSPQHRAQPLALAFHGTHHPDVPGLGFVGFYRSPYWGVIQMQARFLAELWSHPGTALAEPLRRKLAADDSVQRTLALRNDPRLSQFPMGDYAWLMQEFSEALSLERTSISPSGLPMLSYNRQPLDMLTPSAYVSPASNGDSDSKDEAAKSRQDTHNVCTQGLTTPRFVARAVFRSLLGTWKLERDLISRLPSHPSGHFSGTAQFLLRDKTPDGLRCAGGANDDGNDGGEGDDGGMEYLYIEDGDFKTDAGFGFRATRRYVWRYDERHDVLSVWFAKTDDPRRADYLFHEVEFQQPQGGGWSAKAGHLCIDDYYDVNYNFAFEAVNLAEWSIEYTVKGPKKDYTIRGGYRR
ncbi:flavin-binding monooxygenase-like domain-containing protein [Hirsutella rhossiliensis]|uniref:Flavin-binding monooxygenase-like domain-containing protein n=1 Tax=Hirsutella rhossiliensis TaxID=111463 RepID=A0A9P8SJ95_9HYPO|nr:flavin-binding monooxygenase-like domain-containing protein [Hirsutella rhossiliensis]KAH0962826.1 flavin-binding monooxygenase-like domain-containing protein [Hirsutella rhossiliensis]